MECLANYSWPFGDFHMIMQIYLNLLLDEQQQLDEWTFCNLFLWLPLQNIFYRFTQVTMNNIFFY